MTLVLDEHASPVQSGALAVPPAWSPLEIATDRCKGCELCISACPPGVLTLDFGVVNRLGHHPVRLLDSVRCTSCARCARVCPDAVFTIYSPPRQPHGKEAEE